MDTLNYEISFANTADVAAVMGKNSEEISPIVWGELGSSKPLTMYKNDDNIIVAIKHPAGDEDYVKFDTAVVEVLKKEYKNDRDEETTIGACASALVEYAHANRILHKMAQDGIYNKTIVAPVSTLIEQIAWQW